MNEAGANAERVWADGDAAEFVRFFVEGWQKPKPDAFIDHFAARMAPHGRLVQPMSPTVVGPDGLRSLFARVFDLFPDYEVEVADWAVRERPIYLWLVHSATMGRRKISWPGVDRVVLSAAGMIEERVALFDPTAQLPGLMHAPRLWPRAMRLALSRR